MCAFPSATAVRFSEGGGGLRCNSSSAAEEGAVRGGALDACWRLVAVSVVVVVVVTWRCRSFSALTSFPGMHCF